MDYITRFCGCGRIRYIPQNVYDWMAEDYKNREVIWICKNCGATERIFLTEYENGYYVNSTDINEYAEPVQCRIYASSGIPVFMKSGSLADVFIDAYFANRDEWISKENNPDYESIDKSECRGEPWATVDTDRLIQQIKRSNSITADDIIRSIMSHRAARIMWDKTEYGKKESEEEKK